MKNKKGILGSLVVLVLLGLQVIFSENKEAPQDTQNQANSQVQTSQVKEASKNSATPSTSEKGQPSFSSLKTASPDLKVEDVDLTDPPRFQKIALSDIRGVDGDTFVFYIGKKEYRLRLLMVDTPESVKQGMTPAPYGKEASSFTKKQLQQGNISIAFDSGEVKDRYDRYLAYVFVGDRSLQELLLENGYGILRYLNAGGDTYQKELASFQEKAMKQKAGVWDSTGYVKQTKRYYYFEYEDQ